MAGLQLNPPQQEAVLHGEGPCLVIAGAGSGKTRVLTERIRRLVSEGVAPWRILGFTFTNKAAGEMRRRLEESLGDAARRLWLGTFHATGLRILRREADALGLSRDFTIYDADDQLALLKRIMKTMALPEGGFTPQSVRALIENYKSALVTPEQASERAEGFRDALVARIYLAYAKAMRESQALDFTDLISMPVRLFASDPAIAHAWSARFDYLLVDEFQDTNPLQMRFVEQLAAVSGNLFAVGDDDQSIYGWRGADIRHILDFETKYPGTTLIRLEQNYRSTRPILAVANAVIANNTARKGKSLWTAREEGAPVRVNTVLDEEEEAEFIARRIKSQAALGTELGGFAILYRTHAQSRALEAALSRYRLPYQIVGGTRFYDRKEIRDVLAYMKTIANPADSVSLLRILNTPPRGIGKTSVARLLDLAERNGMAPGTLLTGFPELLDELPDAGARKLKDFGRLLLSVCQKPDSEPAPGAIERLLERVPYLEFLRESDSVQGEVRRENVEELLSASQSFYESRLAEALVFAEDTDRAPGVDAPEPERVGAAGSLVDFLAEVALVANIDGMEGEAELVTLMTLHNAKGLEFDTVFISGVEEQLLPHAMSSENEAEIEEERRLFYVGVTRAEERLWIVHAMNRRRFGDMLPCMPSRFLGELPEEHVERQGGELLVTAGGNSYRMGGASRGFQGGRPGGASRSGADWRGGAALSARRPPAIGGSEHFSQDSGEGDFDGEFDQDGGNELRVGMRVRHATLGCGTVHKLEGGGSELRVIVVFEGQGPRKLLARVAGLEQI